MRTEDFIIIPNILCVLHTKEFNIMKNKLFGKLTSVLNYLISSYIHNIFDSHIVSRPEKYVVINYKRR